MNPSSRLPPEVFDLARQRADRLRRAAMHRAWRALRQRWRALTQWWRPTLARPEDATQEATPCPR